MAIIIDRLGERLRLFHPTAFWYQKGNDYDPLVWKASPKPTQAQLEAFTPAELDEARKESLSNELNDVAALKAIVFAVADRLGIARNVLGQEAKAIYKDLV